MDDRDFIEYYRKQVEQLNVSPPNDVWQNISNQLDIDEVWDNISAELDSNNKKQVLWKPILWSAAAMLALFVGSFAFFMTKSETLIQQVTEVEQVKTKNDEVGSVKYKPTPNTTTINNETSTVSENTTANSTYIPEIAQSANGTEPQIVITDSTNSTRIANNELQPYNQKMIPLKPIMLERLALIKNIDNEQDELIAENHNHHDVEYDKDVEKSNRFFSIGFNSSVKNTWLADNKTINSFNEQTESLGKKSFPEFGVNLIYGFNKKWSIESSIIWASRLGQDYKAYVYGQLTNRGVELVYSQYELLARYSYKKRSARLFNCNLVNVCGLYYSTLKSAQESMLLRRVNTNVEYSNTNNVSMITTNAEISTYSKVNNNIVDRFANHDFGLILGAELNVPISRHFSLVPGLRFKMGLTNIYDGRVKYKKNTDIVQNNSLEFRISVLCNLISK